MRVGRRKSGRRESGTVGGGGVCEVGGSRCHALKEVMVAVGELCGQSLGRWEGVKHEVKQKSVVERLAQERIRVRARTRKCNRFPGA